MRLDLNYSAIETPAIIRIFGEICMTIFIMGIGNPMSFFLTVLKPRNLTHAFQYALEFQNTEFRSNINLPTTIPSYTYDNNLQTRYQHQGRIPQRRNSPRYQNNNHHNNHHNNYQNNSQNNNLKKNQPDVDRTMRSRMWSQQKRADMSRGKLNLILKRK